MNSNFVITLSFVKAVMQAQPRGWNLLGECDVPFALPSDTRLFKKQQRNHFLQRREVLTGLESAFDRSPEIDLDVRYEDSCHAEMFQECEVPFLSYILGSLF
ncbi:uncharacterized protein BDFB_011334, partial [Asbolus verrucosus]